MTSRRKALLGGASATVLAPFTRFAHAQATVIDKPARMIVGFPPGGAADLVARLFASQIKGYAPSIIVDNKPGAGGRIALEHVKQSPPDGATLAFTPASMMMLYPHVFKSLPYEPLTDFEPVAPVCKITLALALGPKAPENIKTIPDLIAWYKANPKEASLGYTATGSTQHFTSLLFTRGAGVPITEVPYKGGGPAIQDLLAGQIPAAVAVTSTILPHVAAGKLRILATTGSQRDAALPAAPTFVELEFKDIVANEWFGIFAPAKTPAPIVEKLNRAILDASASKEVIEVLQKSNLEPVRGSASEFAGMLKADHARWAAIIREVGYKPEE